MLDLTDQVCAQFRKKLDRVSLLRRTAARRIEAIGKDLNLQLKICVPSFRPVS